MQLSESRHPAALNWEWETKIQYSWLKKILKLFHIYWCAEVGNINLWYIYVFVGFTFVRKRVYICKKTNNTSVRDFMCAMSLWAVLRLWETRVYVCGQILLLWPFYLWHLFALQGQRSTLLLPRYTLSQRNTSVVLDSQDLSAWPETRTNSDVVAGWSPHRRGCRL